MESLNTAGATDPSGGAGSSSAGPRQKARKPSNPEVAHARAAHLSAFLGGGPTRAATAPPGHLSNNGNGSSSSSNGNGNGNGGTPAAASGNSRDTRTATMAVLVAEGARGERHTRVLSAELYDLEHQLHDMSGELDDAQRQARRHEAAAAADREEVEHVRAELRARHEEQSGLVGRLEIAQRVNEEWHERVRTVSAEFDATAAEWQAQLAAADGKWRAIVDSLRQRLGAAEAQGQADAAKLQSLGLEVEKLSGRLEAARETRWGCARRRGRRRRRRRRRAACWRRGPRRRTTCARASPRRTTRAPR